ncbi:MAG: diguanylate cyclase [Anaerolineales bacterium]|nr:diguanylate cyclase [Anaerolineales bacterium]
MERTSVQKAAPLPKGVNSSHFNKSFVSNILNALPANIAVLNADGIIISVNESWKSFARNNNSPNSIDYIGWNYLGVCEKALQDEGDEFAKTAYQGCLDLLDGKSESFTLEYPCHSPDEKRWFSAQGTRFTEKGAVYIVIVHENITARKLVELDRQYSNEIYQLIFNNSMDAILLTAPEGRILAANPATCLMFGMTEDEIRAAGRNGLMDITDPRLAEGLQERDQTGKFHGELTGLHKDGTKFPIELTSSLFTDHDGKLLTSIIIRDLTTRKQAEIELAESYERFHRLAGSHPDTVYTLNLEERRVTYFNRDSFLGYDRGELSRPNSIQDQIHIEDAAAVTKYSNDFFLGKANGSLEYRVKNKNGQWEWVDSRKIVLSSNPDGTPKEIMVVLRVITDRKQAVEQLEYHSQILANLNDIVIGTDENFRIKYWNPAAERVFGWKYAEVIGKSVTKVLRTEFVKEDYEDSVKAVMDTGIWQGEVIQYTKDNRPISISANIHAQKDAAGRIFGFISANRDITREKLTQQKLADTYKLLEQKNRELEEAIEREQVLARTDGLTGVGNTRQFFEIAAYEFAMAERYLLPLAVMLFDIDKFKGVNDKMGHQIGDQVLKNIAAIAKHRLRETDILARYGGEEFIVLLPNTTSKDAHVVAEDIRSYIAGYEMKSDKGTVQVTISVGIAEFLAGKDSLEGLIHRADMALYKAKELGRNRTVTLSASK